ncbi:serine/threonine-protein kinase ht1 [Phtheirospermum japonicum]|uniref:Serine/threonine-protein kinase ht1 n=1 Tax=Phtheirospermum japonicum TaxID=374723 RepID=A0A830B058_9LAMI|nr:serine/threonine-protein kinase ht1 [Phtheirospermum japonicum]
MEKSSDGFVRADQIDLKSLDEQLERHLNRAWTMEKNRKKSLEDDDDSNSAAAIAPVSAAATTTARRQRHDWEIDPSKLIIKGVIARGTFGTVHRGVYEGQDVAVKLLDWGEEGHRTEAEISSLRAAFTQEVVVWHKLDHPNVTKEQQWALPNLTFKAKMVLSACPVIYVVLLWNIFPEKIVHRDVKTENMLLDKSRTVKIADFGVARVEASNPHDMTGETGTLGYMAPEVLNGNPYNRKCDVYSFGICLWEIYCCDMPYPDLSFSEVTSAVVRQNLRPEIPRCCPSSLANVMKRCWDANPDKRPEMDEVVTMLEAIDTSKGGGMIPNDQQQGCLCFRKHRGP